MLSPPSRSLRLLGVAIVERQAVTVGNAIAGDILAGPERAGAPAPALIDLAVGAGATHVPVADRAVLPIAVALYPGRSCLAVSIRATAGENVAADVAGGAGDVVSWLSVRYIAPSPSDHSFMPNAPMPSA